MPINPDAAFSQGDVMRRLAALERKLQQLETARRAEATAIGRQGIRVRGGSIVIVDESGQESMRLSTAGLTLTGLLRALGDLEVSGSGGIQVTDGGDIVVEGGGGVQVRDGGDVLVSTGGQIRVQNAQGQDAFIASADDVAAIDPATGELVSMSTLAFGEKAGFELGPHSLSAGSSFVELTGGPSVDVIIGESRRCQVTLSARISGSSSGGLMGFAVSGASTIAAVDFRTCELSRSDGTIAGTVSASFLLTAANGIQPGLNTFTAMYKTLLGTCLYANRSLVVKPY